MLSIHQLAKTPLVGPSIPVHLYSVTQCTELWMLSLADDDALIIFVQ